MSFTPALWTGTSWEFAGRRPLPRRARACCVFVLLGPPGSGRTTVSHRLVGPDALVLDARQTWEALSQRLIEGSWPERLGRPGGVILDGLEWLHRRPSAVELLVELVERRIKAGGRTALIHAHHDPSLEAVWSVLDEERTAVIGLRYPRGYRGRLRSVMRLADERRLMLTRSESRRLARMEPWSLAVVATELDSALQSVS